MKIVDVKILNWQSPGADWWKARENAPNEPNSIQGLFVLHMSLREYEALLDHKPIDISPRQNTYEEWAKGGGPNECKHGIAAGIPCHECSKDMPKMDVIKHCDEVMEKAFLSQTIGGEPEMPGYIQGNFLGFCSEHEVDESTILLKKEGE